MWARTQKDMSKSQKVRIENNVIFTRDNSVLERFGLERNLPNTKTAGFHRHNCCRIPTINLSALVVFRLSCFCYSEIE